jgi:hypothetical protein
MTLPVNSSPDLPGPTPPVQPIEVSDLPPTEPKREKEREEESDPGRLPDDKPRRNLDDPSIGDVLRDLT